MAILEVAESAMRPADLLFNPSRLSRRRVRARRAADISIRWGLFGIGGGVTTTYLVPVHAPLPAGAPLFDKLKLDLPLTLLGTALAFLLGGMEGGAAWGAGYAGTKVAIYTIPTLQATVPGLPAGS